MKRFRVLKWGIVFALTTAMSVAFANLAPVESIPTQDMQQMPSDTNPQASNDQNIGQNNDMNPQQSDDMQSASPSTDNVATSNADQQNNNNTENFYDTNTTTQNQTNTDANAANQTPSSELTDSERVSRLEQQMSNMTRMNFPQQINALRQEIQQLNGQLQMQEHDIQVLGKQQRSFYQDLNSRVQQLIGSGNVSPSIARTASQAKANTAVADASMGDSNAYRAAFGLLVKRQYPAAIGRFKAYINNYPKGAFVANAYYWLGEIYLKENDAVNAQKSFDTVVSRYPKSNKVPDAKLKMAIIRINLGEKAEGRRQLQAIKRQYPGSTAAQLASIQLQRMQ